jgi:hypothetical protein
MVCIVRTQPVDILVWVCRGSQLVTVTKYFPQGAGGCGVLRLPVEKSSTGNERGQAMRPLCYLVQGEGVLVHLRGVLVHL